MKMKQEIPTKVVTNSFKKKTGGRRLLTMIGKPVLYKAEQVQTGLNPNYPSFIKLMLPSNVTAKGTYWLNIRSAFCNPNLPRKNIDLTLLDEQGEEYTVKYLASIFSLSAGWRRFALAHKLVEGDALVFHLIEATKFKVYIVRSCSLADVDRACDLPTIDIPAQGSVPDGAGAKEGKIIKKCTGKYLSSHSAVPIPAEDQHMVLPSKGGKETNATNRNPAENRTSHSSVPFLSGDQSTNLEQPETNATKRSPAENRTESNQQPEDHNFTVEDTEVLEGVRLPEPIAGIQDFTNLDSFTIIVNDMLIDLKMSEDIRIKYYELCRSQKTYLHKHLMEGLNHKIVDEIICHTVNIADAIRDSKPGTPEDTFKAWEKSLLVYKLLGMDVEFLLSRVGMHLQHALAFGAMMEENRLKEEIAAREAKILELRNDSIRLEREQTTLQGNREKQELAFQSMVNSPW